MAVFGLVLLGATRNNQHVPGYPQAARSASKYLVPIGLGIMALGVLAAISALLLDGNG